MFSTAQHVMQLYAPIATLTTREAEIVVLVAVGLSAKEIALRLQIAPRTVDRHVDHVKMKTHARNRAHMIGMGYALQTSLVLDSGENV